MQENAGKRDIFCKKASLWIYKARKNDDKKKTDRVFSRSVIIIFRQVAFEARP